ncbi:hypothetical protein MK280_02455 [Myxococcota bacterium]|nr:hypothetical protein [Myxococcota bacterium]
MAENPRDPRSSAHEDPHVVKTGDQKMGRALRSNPFWLSLSYLGVLLLMARAYI